MWDVLLLNDGLKWEHVKKIKQQRTKKWPLGDSMYNADFLVDIYEDNQPQ